MEDKFQNRSFLISFILHAAVTLSLLLINFSITHEEPEYVTIGFGGLGNMSSSGRISEDVKKESEKSEIQKEQDVSLPKSSNLDEDDVIAKSSDKKNRLEESVKSLTDENNNANKGREFYGEGAGKFGFDIDFGGQGIRKIYNYNLPKYPDGVFKEIDVKLRFTILADGTVGNIIPLRKADTKLEDAAIKSLRQWRFEPLSKNQKTVEQVAVIIFPFRLE